MENRYRRPPRGRLSGRHDRVMLECPGAGKYPGSEPLAEAYPRAESVPHFSLGNKTPGEKDGTVKVAIGVQVWLSSAC